MRTYKFYLNEQKFNNINDRPLSVYFVTTESVGDHYEGHKHGTDKSSEVLHYLFMHFKDRHSYYKSNVIINFNS